MYLYMGINGVDYIMHFLHFILSPSFLFIHPEVIIEFTSKK